MGARLNVFILTGAGLSAESGLKTFRDANGLWENERIEDVATPEAFLADPSRVHRFYNLRRKQLSEVEPNAAHRALARLQAQWPEGSSGQRPFLVTQNVDDLHERAGAMQVHHIHGELRKVRCLKTGEVFPWSDDLEVSTPHPRWPDKRGLLRPHICWFGEVPFDFALAESMAEQCDIFIAIGTSGVVYPVAGLISVTKPNCRRILVNLDRPENARAFDEFRLGPATVEVPKLVAELLASG